MERVSWLDRYACLTSRLAGTVAHWCMRLPIRHVAELFGLHWEMVRKLDQRRLLRQLTALLVAQPRRLVMDEFALYKGYRYATVVLNADTRCVLWGGSTVDCVHRLGLSGELGKIGWRKPGKAAFPPPIRLSNRLFVY